MTLDPKGLPCKLYTRFIVKTFRVWFWGQKIERSAEALRVRQPRHIFPSKG